MCEPNSWISLQWHTLLLTHCLSSPPLQGPQYEQHQSAAPKSPPQPPLPRRAVSTAAVWLHPVTAEHIPAFVSHTCCGNQMKRVGEAVSTNKCGTWKHLGGGAGGRTAVILEIKL